MEDKLLSRIRQINSAINVSTNAYSADQIIATKTDSGATFVWNPNANLKTEDLSNQVSAILSAIGSIKDYFNAWCKANGRKPLGDEIINSNASVALVHDLWIVDKHVTIDRQPPRSGFYPRIGDLYRGLRVMGDGQPGTQDHDAIVVLNLLTGSVENGEAQIVLSATIYDEHGIARADFRDVCEQATDVWVSELRKAGLEL